MCVYYDFTINKLSLVAELIDYRALSAMFYCGLPLHTLS